jgi:hypothetical protein
VTLIPAEIIELSVVPPPPIDLYLVAACDRRGRWKISAHPTVGWTLEQAQREMRQGMESRKFLAVGLVHVQSQETMR